MASFSIYLYWSAIYTRCLCIHFHYILLLFSWSALCSFRALRILFCALFSSILFICPTHFNLCDLLKYQVKIFWYFPLNICRFFFVSIWTITAFRLRNNSYFKLENSIKHYYHCVSSFQDYIYPFIVIYCFLIMINFYFFISRNSLKFVSHKNNFLTYFRNVLCDTKATVFSRTTVID